MPSPRPHSAQPHLALSTTARGTPHLLPRVLLSGVRHPSSRACPSLSQFNSMILYCVPKLRLMGQKFSVREKMDISGLQVGEPLPRNLVPWESTEQVEGHRALTAVRLVICLLL